MRSARPRHGSFPKGPLHAPAGNAPLRRSSPIELTLQIQNERTDPRPTELCRLFLPRPIHDRSAYENTVEIADVFAGNEERMSDGQNDYFDLLCDIIEKYELVSTPAPKLGPLALLNHLIKEHGLSGADLSRILGKSLPLGPKILRGERRITADHAVILGKHFGVRPDAFLA